MDRDFVWRNKSVRKTGSFFFISNFTVSPFISNMLVGEDDFEKKKGKTDNI